MKDFCLFSFSFETVFLRSYIEIIIYLFTSKTISIYSDNDLKSRW